MYCRINSLIAFSGWYKILVLYIQNVSFWGTQSSPFWTNVSLKIFQHQLFYEKLPFERCKFQSCNNSSPCTRIQPDMKWSKKRCLTYVRYTVLQILRFTVFLYRNHVRYWLFFWYLHYLRLFGWIFFNTFRKKLENKPKRVSTFLNTILGRLNNLIL